MQVLDFMLGTGIQWGKILLVSINNQTASGFIGLVAFPFEGRRIVIPIH